MDPQAAAMLDQVAMAYKALRGLHLRARVVAKVRGRFASEEMPETVEMWFERPAKLRVAMTKRRPNGKRIKTLAVSDGTRLWRWSSDTNTYTVAAHEPSALRSEMTHALPEGAMLMDGTPRALLRDMGDASVRLYPPQQKGGVDVEVLMIGPGDASAGMNVAQSYYVRRSDHLLQGFRATATGPGGPSQAFDVEMRNQVIEANPTFAPNTFRFARPPGARLDGAKPARKR
jgi:outer membrane lipoprotein-sorting protein